MEKNEVLICLKQQNLAIAMLIHHCHSCGIYKRESILIIAILFLSTPFPFCLVQMHFFQSTFSFLHFALLNKMLTPCQSYRTFKTKCYQWYRVSLDKLMKERVWFPQAKSLASWSVSLRVCSEKVEMIRLKLLQEYHVSSSRVFLLTISNCHWDCGNAGDLASNLLTSYYSYLYENNFIFVFA